MADTTPGAPENPARPDPFPGEPKRDVPGDEVPGGRPGEHEGSREPSGRADAADADTGSGAPQRPRPAAPQDLMWHIPEDTGPEPADDPARSHPEAALYAGPAGAATGEPTGAEARQARLPAGRSRQRGGAWRLAALALGSGILGAALSAAAVWWIMDDGGDEPPAAVTVVTTTETQIPGPRAAESTAAVVARRVLPSIVTVEITRAVTGDFVADGSGSGVVLTADGLLVTNEHVVGGASAVRVVFADGRIYEAEVVGADPLSDLALLRISATGLTPVAIGSTETMQIGDTAIAVGSPLGLGGGPSVTVGVVSAFDRRVQTGLEDELFGMLQTDAPITRGSSGGALVDGEGRLIGITTAIGISDVGAEGLGFAIPIEMVNRITEDLLEDGVVSHAFLGVQGTTFFEEASDGATVPAGVSIASVVPGTAAEAAGLQPGDRIRSVDGVRVTTMEQLVVRIRLFRVGDTVELVTARGTETLTISMTLMERPEGV